MTTAETVLLIVLASLMIIFFLLDIVIAIVVLKLLKGVQRVVAKAEGVVDSVEEVADVFAKTSGRLTIFKLVKNIVKAAQRSRK